MIPRVLSSLPNDVSIKHHMPFETLYCQFLYITSAMHVVLNCKQICSISFNCLGRYIINKMNIMPYKYILCCIRFTWPRVNIDLLKSKVGKNENYSRIVAKLWSLYSYCWLKWNTVYLICFNLISYFHA